MGNWPSILVLALITLSLVNTIRKKGTLKESLRIISTIRMGMILQNIPIIALTAAIGLMLNQLPVLNWGWTSLLSSDGSTSNINQIGLQYIWFAPIFGVLLVVALPKLTQGEEEVFRKGTPNWASGIKRSIVFGLVHLIAGISLAFAVALTIPGIWFTYQYFKGGVERSTAYHTAYNLTLVTGLIIAITASFLS